jgi:hypothetical protein
MKGQHYDNHDTVQKVVGSWLLGAGTDFYCTQIFKLVQHWQKCMNHCGDFVDK